MEPEELAGLDNEDLAKHTAQALEETAKKGRQAWEELFQALDSMDEGTRDEVREFLAEWVEKEEV